MGDARAGRWPCVPRCHLPAPEDLVPSPEHPWLGADISPCVSLETRQLLWKPPSSSSFTILILTPERGGLETGVAPTHPLDLGVRRSHPGVWVHARACLHVPVRAHPPHHA